MDYTLKYFGGYPAKKKITKSKNVLAQPACCDDMFMFSQCNCCKIKYN